MSNFFLAVYEAYAVPVVFAIRKAMIKPTTL